jgi:erythrocyte band 7 integral membrane protein
MSATPDTHKEPTGLATNGNYQPSRSTAGRSDNPLVHVEPPRREDLQPSYAQVLQGDDVSAHGWYGSMVNTSFAPLERFKSDIQ